MSILWNNIRFSFTMKCKHCPGHCIKAGMQKNGIQNFHCKACLKYQQACYHYNSYEVADKSISSIVKESCGILSISRLLAISTNTVLRRTNPPPDMAPGNSCSEVNNCSSLQLQDEDRLQSYLSRLIEQNIVVTRGVKKGTEYLVKPKLLASSRINIKPTLKVIDPPRLKALIEETLKLSPKLSISDIHTKLVDVPIEDRRKTVYSLVKQGVLEPTGGKTFRQYTMAKKKELKKKIEKETCR